MPLYTLLLDGAVFHGEVIPFLGETWRRRNFRVCGPLWAAFRPKAEAFAARYRIPGHDLLLCQDVGTMTFDRHSWQLLAGETLMVAAADIPEIEMAPNTLCCLLGSEALAERATARAKFAPIQQALYGFRDLAFGTKLFRPEYVGYNDVADVIRLAAYLGSIDMASCCADSLRPLPGMSDIAERQAELEDAREWFPLFAEMYQRAADARQVIVTEIL